MSALFRLPPVDTHSVASRHVDQTFRIQVARPILRPAETRRFPVLYVTEANLTFDVARILALSLQAASQLRRFIIVGIGYPEDTPFASGILRGRDLTPPNYPDIPGLPRTSIFEGVAGVQAHQKRIHGGPDFLAFIRDELIPLIDARYPTLAGDRGFFGHSLGGRLGLHALFANPDIFNRYIVSSPGLSWEDHEHGLEEARDFVRRGPPVNAHLFMSVSENEEFEQHLGKSRMVSSFYRLAAFLRAAPIPGFDLRTRVFKDETHASVWPVAFHHGARELYGPPEQPLFGTPSWAQPVTAELSAPQ